MNKAMCRWSTVMVALFLISEVSVHNFDPNYRFAPYVINADLSEMGPYSATVSDEEYIRHIHSMFNAYPDDNGGRMVVETNALIDTKYRTLKRNADLINSLLSFPKGMNDAGR